MDAAPQISGSELLLYKLPLVARARALARQDPADARAECNVLSYGADVYRVLSSMGSPVTLPTDMMFLRALEAVQREENVAEMDTDTTAAVHKNEKGSETSDDEDEDEAEAVGSAQRGKEELRLLHAIREPLERVHGSVRGSDSVAGNNTPASPVYLNKGNSSDSTGISSGISRGVVVAPPGRILWTLMLESLMTRGAAGSEADAEKVRSYLRRVSWIEQQKKLHSVPSEGGEESWMNMSESMRVQREIQRMRTQRNRFHREKKQ